MFLWLAIALAQDSPPMPYRPEVVGQGRGLHLLDLSGVEVPTDQALLWIGMPEEAAMYRRRTRTRNVTSVLLFASSGAALLGIPPLLMGVAAPLRGNLPPVAAMSLIGSGLIVRYARLDAHLGAWQREQVVRSRLAAVAATSDPDDPRLQAARLAVLTEQGYSINERGRLIQGPKAPVSMEVLLRVHPAPEVEAAFRRQRRWDKALYIPPLILGSGVATVGMGMALFQLLPDVGADSESILRGLTVAGLGTAAIGVGVTGMVVSSKIHNNPSHWYSSEELEQIQGEREYELRYRLQLLHPRSSLEVYPVIGPGMVGLTGYF